MTASNRGGHPWLTYTRPVPVLGGQSARDENNLGPVHESTLTLFVIMQQQKGPHAKRFPKAPSFCSELFRCQCCAE